ncbi:MAG: N-acetyltransferase [Xanthomonadaceae bacterium]|nr:N-acetyltransferase [Xanthomonadaceae bacterium]
MNIRVIQNLNEIEPAAWNRLQGTDNPFLRHEFLHAFETHRCIHPGNGWQPFHLLLEDGGRILAAAPAYLKGHSWGEFVFDFSWADAHAQRGPPYYPKLIFGVPYSPATGPRVLSAPELSTATAAAALADAARQLLSEHALSSAHWLFPTAEQARLLAESGYMLRHGCQFHWENRGYRDFDDFLAALSAKKRKNLRQERRRVREAGIEFEWLHGTDASSTDWLTFERFYRDTFLAYGNVPILNASFFQDVGRHLGDRVLLVLARQRGRTVAGALFLRSSDTLYGRYWGSSIALSGLHFETCYYQGIEYCIRHGLQRFEPGAQGEHKVARGFLPSRTYSAHWIKDPQLQRVIAAFLQREKPQVAAYMEYMSRQSPFRQAPDT